MNYWKQFAEMLGLELGEKFELTYDDGTINEDTYKIEEDGFYYKNKQGEYWLAEPSTTVNKLINGYCKAVPKQWKPKDGDAYWKWEANLELAQFKRWNGSSTDFACWKLGNCFKTSGGAQSKGKEIMEELLKEYEEE